MLENGSEAALWRCMTLHSTGLSGRWHGDTTLGLPAHGGTNASRKGIQHVNATDRQRSALLRNAAWMLVAFQPAELL